MGLSFRRKDKLSSYVQDTEFYLLAGKIPLFGSPTIHNLMYGNLDDISVTLFDYAYSAGRGPSYEQTVALFCSESINLPNFDLRPEGVFHKIGNAIGYQDIDFESHPRFSSSYLLRGEDENAIRRIFTDDVLTFFSNSTGLSVEARGNKLIYYRHGERAKPDDLLSFFHEARSIFELFRESQGR